jgi:hypothetical protein
MTEPIMITAQGGPDRSRVKKLMIAGAVVFLLVVVVPKVFLGGGGSKPVDDSYAPPAGSARPTSTAKPATTGSSTSGAASTRNPFHALLALDSSGGGGAAASTAGIAQPVSSALPSAVVTTVDSFPFPGSTAGPSSAPAAGSTSSAAPATSASPTAPPLPGPGPRVVRRFTVLAIYTDGTGLPGARIGVDDAVTDVAEGQDFFGSYRALSLNPDSKCGVFLFGDQRFSLCEGEVTRT